MGSNNFKYKRPEGTLHKISIKDYNSQFASRGRYPFTTVEVYLEADQATLHFRPSLFGKFILLLLSPLFYVLMTIQHGYKETHTAFKDVLFDKRRGSYTTGRFYRKNLDSWSKLMYLIRK